MESLQAQEMLGGLQRRVDREVTKGMDTLSQAEAELQVSLHLLCLHQYLTLLAVMAALPV